MQTSAATTLYEFSVGNLTKGLEKIPGTERTRNFPAVFFYRV